MVCDRRDGSCEREILGGVVSRIYPEEGNQVAKAADESVAGIQRWARNQSLTRRCTVYTNGATPRSGGKSTRMQSVRRSN
jgi:hypothetical protein